MGYPWLTSFVYDKSLSENTEETASNIEQNIESFSVYPNPSTTDFSVNGLDESSETQITLYDLTGKILKYFTSSEKSIVITTSDIPSGSFIAKIQNGKAVEFKKLVKY